MNNSQELANVIKKRAKSLKISIGTLLSNCELSKNTLSSMQSGGYYPRIEALCKIADYLDCSVDYLLGLTDEPEELIIPPEDAELLARWEEVKKSIPNMSPEKKELIKKFLSFSDNDAKKASKMVDSIHEEKSNNEEGPKK